MFTYILFDLDGTLTDPKIGITTSVQYALHDFGIEEDNLDRLEKFIGPPLHTSFMEYYGFSDEDAWKAVEKYRERFNVTGIYENEIYPGIPELLKHLKESGKKIAVASSKPTELVKRVLDYFSISQYFDYILGSEMDGKIRGTKEEVVEDVLRYLVPGWDEEHTWHWVELMPEEREARKHNNEKRADIAMVGDRKFDIQGAHAFGLTGIGVSFGYAQGDELEREGADRIVDSVAELEEVLLQG